MIRCAYCDVESDLTREHVIPAWYGDAVGKADLETYFGVFASDAVFLGTDASERWTIDEFRAFAEPYFSTGRGWTYLVEQRHIAVDPSGTTAWFDEILSNDSYGTCRGTGVLLLQGSEWKVVRVGPRSGQHAP